MRVYIMYGKLYPKEVASIIFPAGVPGAGDTVIVMPARFTKLFMDDVYVNIKNFEIARMALDSAIESFGYQRRYASWRNEKTLEEFHYLDINYLDDSFSERILIQVIPVLK